ncbi:hypothetical protein U472_15350 [Orenia metallireducens]|uniref:Uncharacterized protein n=1 Tax=Orenia metallireducens TaxID=1413210 RepID=A0A1C0A6C3_9FIRM|nr:hypothetical protein [Orenia metallireducens]OCL25702.1 hypothetical protein U472_15350 [Orenia metallireducens]
MKRNNISMDSINMSPKDVEKYLQISINNYNVEIKENIKDSEVLDIIMRQLKVGIPVPIFYSTIDITKKYFLVKPLIYFR